MPKRGETLLSSEEDSEDSCGRPQHGAGNAEFSQEKATAALSVGETRQADGSHPADSSRQKSARKLAGGHGGSHNSPMYPGVPGQGSIMAAPQQEEESAERLQEGDAEPPSREEGEVLSDQEDAEDMKVTAQSSRLFQMDDYQYLLSKAVAALHLGEAQSGEGSSKRKATSLHKGDGEFFPSNPNAKKVFPFPEYFETQVINQWEKPAANKRCPNFLRKLYDLPAYANNILQVPIIDGPVAALQSSGLVSKDGRGQIKDFQDRRSEQFCKRTHEAAAMAIRASATASIVSRASIVWARKVLELLPPTETKAIEGVNRMLKAASFAADATLDSVTFSARSMASAVATRRLLWLRMWQTDWRSKSMVSECAFQGEKLFGEDLKEFLVDPKEKPKHLPKPFRAFDRKQSSNSSFRPQQGSSQFKRDNFRRPYWNQSRQQPKKGFHYKKNTGPERYNQDNRQSKA
uniref:Uncharacterized protein n=1 Tax=Sphaerodactylus townsendi TaxID=933632 RepID=A0ACB8FNX0_9SAUR